MTACTLVHGLGLASLIFFLTPYGEIFEKTRRTTGQTHLLCGSCSSDAPCLEKL